MALQIIGTKKCKETRKAVRFFKDRGVSFHLVDISERTLSPGEWNSVFSVLPPEYLIDESSAYFKKKQMKFMDYDAREELTEHSELLKTPLIRDGRKITTDISDNSLKGYL